MNLSHLRTFVTVADAGGFSAVPAYLNLSQSAASRQIIALEAELGVSLFDRVGRRIVLTSEAKICLRAVAGYWQTSTRLASGRARSRADKLEPCVSVRRHKLWNVC
jgi:DNA-binding transcriptional LysR family regulator